MNTLKLSLISIVAIELLELNTLATPFTSVYFNEGAEGALVNVVWDSTHWLSGADNNSIPPVINSAGPQAVTAESATFVGYQPLPLLSSMMPSGGTKIFALTEANGAVSDYVSVSWAPANAFYDTAGLLVPGYKFSMSFFSDVEGTGLSVTPDLSQLETGSLQSVDVNAPYYDANLELAYVTIEVWITSDVDNNNNVPDAGLTLVLLGMSAAGLVAFYRWQGAGYQVKSKSS